MSAERHNSQHMIHHYTRMPKALRWEGGQRTSGARRTLARGRTSPLLCAGVKLTSGTKVS